MHIIVEKNSESFTCVNMLPVSQAVTTHIPACVDSNSEHVRTFFVQSISAKYKIQQRLDYFT